MSDKRVVIDHFQSVRDGGSDHGPARFAGAALPARPRPLSPQPAPEALSSAVRPERRGRSLPVRRRRRLGQPVGCDPKGLLGAVASVRGLGRRCRRPWLPAAPVYVAEYLTALVGKGRGSCHGAANGFR